MLGTSCDSITPQMSPMPRGSSAPKRRLPHRKLQRLLMIIVIIIIILFGVIYGWDYRPQTLIDETTSIRESYVRQVNIDTSFGSRNVEIVVETLQIPTYVTFWWQQGTTNARILFGNQQVQVNSTSTTNVSVQNPGGTYYLMVAKSETECAPCMNCEAPTCVTTIHVVVKV